MVKHKEFERRQRKCTGFGVFQIKFVLSFGYQKTVSIGRVRPKQCCNILEVFRILTQVCLSSNYINESLSVSYT
jgi:hypothetical protein